MMRNIICPTLEKIIEYNLLLLDIIKAKKADKSELLSYSKLKQVIEECKNLKGDIYDKAVVLLKGLIQKHPFASGNRRTAFIVTKEFLLKNKAKMGVKDDPKQAKIVVGIREGFYSDNEIKEWLKKGDIHEFKR